MESRLSSRPLLSRAANRRSPGSPAKRNYTRSERNKRARRIASRFAFRTRALCGLFRWTALQTRCGDFFRRRHPGWSFRNAELQPRCGVLSCRVSTSRISSASLLVSNSRQIETLKRLAKITLVCPPLSQALQRHTPRPCRRLARRQRRSRQSFPRPP